MAYTKTNWVNGTTPLNDKNMNKIENELENLDTNISKSTDEYSSTSTYSIGELVIYNNKLYKANQDITTAEAFNSSHWTEVTLLSDVNEIKSVVNNNADNLNNLNDVIDAKANTSDVYTKTELDTKINAKQDKLSAGNNITIANNTISAKDTTYSTATSSIDGLMSKTDKSKLDNIFKSIYPVGSIYMSVNSTNPSTLFGGTWTRIANGRTLIGVDENNGNFNSAKKTGGSFSHNHTNPSTGSHVLTLNEMPDRLIARINLTKSTDQQHDNTYTASTGWKNICLADAVNTKNISQVGLGHTHTTTIPQYFTCYIWQRTA